MKPNLTAVHRNTSAECMTYQKATEKQTAALKAIAPYLTEAYKAIEAVIPVCADRSVALRKLRECRMWANSAIVFAPDECLVLDEAGEAAAEGS